MRSTILGLTILTLGFAPALIGASAQVRGAEPPIGAERALGAIERALIEEYFGTEAAAEPEAESEEGREVGEPRRGKGGDKGGGRGDGLPPGLAKRDSLPPGLARQVERTGSLPPGLEGRALPRDLERRLPPEPEGTRRVIVDDDIVLIDPTTRAVLDVLRGVVRDGR